MKTVLVIAASTLAASLAALALSAAFDPADPALAQFLVGLGYFGLVLAPISTVAVIVTGGLSLVRIARADAAANRTALEK